MPLINEGSRHRILRKLLECVEYLSQDANRFLRMSQRASQTPKVDKPCMKRSNNSH